MSLKDLKDEILKPIYIMCNECTKFHDFTCEIYKAMPPKSILLANPFKEKENKEICEHFEQS